MTQDAELSVRRQTVLIGIARGSLSYKAKVSEGDVITMRAIDELYTEHPFYGSRKLRIALRRSYQILIGRNHVRRLMRLMGLEAIYPKARPHTSDPNVAHRIYPYLLSSLTASYPNHIWGTDITYIRLSGGFCYLVAIIDWYSRYVVHWELSATLEIEFCLTNLTQSLRQAVPCIHNSDQGSHFTSPRYVDLLLAVNAQVSMDGRGRCMDNIFTERLWRTVKYEEVYLKSYQTIEEARDGLTAYFQFYNHERPHQALDYRTAAELYGRSKKPASAGYKIQRLNLSTLSTILV